MNESIKVVILCGGKGTRSYPFTQYFPKVMMPIDGKPIIVHLMESFAHQGFTEFVLAAGYRQEILVDYFTGRFGDWSITVVDTGGEAETGERIKRCAPLVGETFFATYGDGLGNVNLNNLLSVHRNQGATATVTTVPLRSQYGVIKYNDDGQVIRFNEKPVIENHWINAGFFVFQKSVFEHWRGNVLETEVLPNLAEQKMLYTYPHQGFWQSMDTSKDQEAIESIHNTAGPIWLQATESNNTTKQYRTEHDSERSESAQSPQT